MLNLQCSLYLLSILIVNINSAMAAEVAVPPPSSVSSSSSSADNDDMAVVVRAQAQALIAFKDAITHDPSSCLSSWTTTTTTISTSSSTNHTTAPTTSDSDVVHTTAPPTYCSYNGTAGWYGLLCDGRFHITSLNLSSCSLSGSISPSLALLPSLSLLDLSYNNFSGSLLFFSTQPSHSSSLTYLDLSSNAFLSGDIPTSLILNSPNLQTLRLSYTGLSGLVPPEIWTHLPALQQLVISGISSVSSPPFLSISPTSFPPSANFSFCATTQVFELSGLDASGASFPSSLGDCQQLQTLTLSMTGLQGFIPPSIWQLPHLQKLFINDYNVIETVYNHPDQPRPYKLHGSLPSTFGFCGAAGSTMEDMYIGGINLTGHIPASIGTCTSLQNLELSHTSLEGPIPSNLGNLTTLKVLALWKNNLEGPIPSSLGNLIQLWALVLRSNNLEGPIPSSLGNLTQLLILYLHNNNLEGPIPSSLGNLIQLGGLDLESNNLVGSIPSSLGNLSQLLDLHLNNNKLTGKIPTALGCCSKLVELRLGFNTLRGSIPRELGMLIKLEELSLFTNSLEGIVPVDAVHNLTALKVLRLFQNKLTGKIESLDLSKLPNLQRFSVFGNALEGGLPAGLTESKALIIFDVQRNKYLTGTLGNTATPHITGLSKLRVLSVSYNQLSGDIPGWVWKLPSLQALDLSNNHFSGRFPETLTYLSYFKRNQTSNRNQTTLYEDVPVTIKNTVFTLTYVLSARIYIDVSMNNLEGEIPQSFEELQGLTGANLSHNNISGRIPEATFGRLMQLEVLDLSCNQLSGGIPQDLTSVDRLSTLNLAHNQLEGPIPTQNNFNTRFTSDSFEDNPGLCGYPLSSSCNTSSNASSDMGTTAIAMQMHQLVVIRFNDFVSLWALLIAYPLGLALGFWGCSTLSV